MFVANVSLNDGGVVVIGLVVVVGFVNVAVVGFVVPVGFVVVVGFVDPVGFVVVVVGFVLVIGTLVWTVVVGISIICILSNSLFILARVAAVIANVTIVKIDPKTTIGTKIFIHLRALYALTLLSIFCISPDTIMNRNANESVE
jgi:hypothetical protein